MANCKVVAVTAFQKVVAERIASVSMTQQFNCHLLSKEIMMAMARPSPSSEEYARYSVLEYLLIGDLRDLWEEPADAETRRWLLAILDELLDLLPNEFEYEDQDGYLADVSELFPNWAPRIHRLHIQHDGLYFTLLELRNRIGQQESFEYIAEEVKPELSRWIETAQQLRSDERHLVVSAYDLTLGGEG